MGTSGHEQRGVIMGIGLAWVLSGSFLFAGWKLSVHFDWFAQTTQMQSLAYTLILPALSLVMGIGWAARTRFFQQDIDGSDPDAGTPLDITRRYIQNTTEQLLVFTIAAICFSTLLPDISPSILPVFGLWFFMARMMFWIGYIISPMGRAIGFASTFHPTIALLVFALLKMVMP